MNPRWINSAETTQEERAAALKQLDALVSEIPENDLTEAQIAELVDKEVKAARAEKTIPNRL
jgi:antitoxin component HigA of HigAB toxin-antitoxin module